MQSTATATQVIINHNTDKGGVEIKFATKPEPSVLEELKSNRFRWSRFNKCWYSRVNAQALQVASKYGTLPQTLQATG